MVRADEVILFVDRITGVWRTRNQEYKDELRRFLLRAVKPDWEPSDINGAFDTLLQVHPVTAKDGGPAMPPNPGEVLGMILTQRRNRQSAGERSHTPAGVRVLRNRPCPKCNGPRLLVPGEPAYIYCQSPCNRSERYISGGSPLEFADPPPISEEEVTKLKERYSIGTR